jgi:hypothetical protein
MMYPLPWLASDIRNLRHAAAKGLTLRQMALRAQHPAAECDIALWEALGRTNHEAARAMNARQRARAAA